MIFALDASAMIAYLRGEEGSDVVAKILSSEENRCIAHVVNLCEVFYDFHRAGGQESAISALKDLALAGVIESAEISTLFWQTVGTLKSIHKRVSLADCFLIALADQRGATVLTADHHEFDVLEKQAVCLVSFIR